MRRAGILTCLLFVLNGCQAGIQIHNPQTLQETSNLFNFVKDMTSKGTKTTYIVDREYYMTNMVTMCPLNVVFVLDGSDSVSPNGFELARAALIREIQSVYNQFANTDVGVIMFSDTTKENDVLKLQTRSPSQLQRLIQEVQSLVQPRRKTALPIAIKRAREELIDYSMSTGRKAYDGYRSGSLMVLITDGVPNNKRATIQEAKLASDNHIIIISVSIENANQELLRDISNVVQEYRTPIDWASSVACPATVLPPVTTPDHTCDDFLLITDGSDSVLRFKETVRQYLTYTALRFRYVTNRIGVKLFATDASAQSRDTMIRPMSDKFALAEAIREKLVFPRSGGTGTDIAINQAVAMMKEDPRPRRMSLVLITDGPPLNPDAVRQAIQNAIYNNFQVIIIRVGTVLTDAMLNRMAGSGNTIYSVNDFTGLYSVEFSTNVCLDNKDILCSAPKVLVGQECVCPSQCPADAPIDSSCRCQCLNANKVYTSGQCICRQTASCGYNQVRNPQTCQCEPRCTNQCPPYSTRNDNTCECMCQSGRSWVPATRQCVCNTICPSDARINNVDCGCQCTNVNKVYQNRQCVCRQTVSCGYNQVRNPQTCQCEPRCTNQCPPYSTRNDNTCECLCQSGRTKVGNQCVCNTRCPSDARINNVDCGCQCTNVNKVYQNRQCVCRQTVNCGFNQVINPQTCQCEPKCSNQCPAYSTRNDNTCECICQSGRSWVPATRQCVCNTRCPSDARINNVDCGCQCTNVNKVYQNRQCVCRQTANCGFNQVRNPQTCQCEPRCTNQCPLYSTRNDNTCECLCQSGRTKVGVECVCNTRCPSDARINNVNCGCQCTNVNKVYQNGQCVCRQTVSCGFNQVRNPQTCQCEPKCTNQCPAYSTRNDNTCECVCQSGRSWVPATRQCVCNTRCPSDARINNVDCGCQCTNVNKVYQNRQCVCRQTVNCGFNQVRNPQTCQCEPRCTNQCPPYSTRNDNTCECLCQSGRTKIGDQCVCNTRCPSDARINNVDCGCQCTNVNKVYQNRQCVCRQTVNCGFNQVINPQTCQCEPRCTNQCPVYSTRNDNTCECVCQSGRSWVPATRQCVCNTRCPSDARINNVDCGCQCTNVNKVYQNRQCVCRQTASCGYNQVRNPQTCQCESRCTNQCPPYSTRNDQCLCVCDAGRQMNQNGQCVVPQTGCPASTCFNNQTALQDCNGNCYCKCNVGFSGDRCEIRSTGELCNDCEYVNGQYLAGIKGSCQLFVTCMPAAGQPTDGRTRPSSFSSAIVRACAPGTLFVTRPNGYRSCDYPGAGTCEQDMCANLPANAKYTDNNSCRTYWTCGAKQTTMGRSCCPQGTGFDSRSGQCRADVPCQLSCPLEAPNCSGTVCRETAPCGPNQVRNPKTCRCEAKCTNQCPLYSYPNDQCNCVCQSGRVMSANGQCITQCNRGVVAGNPNQWYYLNNPSLIFNCNSGGFFNLQTCSCVNQDKDVRPKCDPTVSMDFESTLKGEFSKITRTQIPGHTSWVADLVRNPLDIIFKKFSSSGFYSSYFEIDVKIKVEGQVSGNGKTAVVTNADCNVDDSVSITMDRQNFYFRVLLEGLTTPAVISIPYNGRQDSDGFYSLKLVYIRGQAFTGTVGTYTETYTGSLSGPIAFRKCAIHLGRGFGYQTFVGYVDDLYIWRCNPN